MAKTSPTSRQSRRVVTCMVIKLSKDEDTAALLRRLFNRLADDRPGGRRNGRQPIKVGDKRSITLKGPRIPSLLMFLARLEAAGVLQVTR